MVHYPKGYNPGNIKQFYVKYADSLVRDGEKSTDPKEQLLCYTDARSYYQKAGEPSPLLEEKIRQLLKH